MMACAETPLPREQRFIDQAPCAARQVQFTRVNDTDTRRRLRIMFSVAQPWKFDPKADLVSHLLFFTSIYRCDWADKTRKRNEQRVGEN